MVKGRACWHRNAVMSYSAYPVPQRRWPLIVPFAVVAALAVGWTAFWFYASQRTATEIAAWRAREASAGRVQNCTSQTIGGYPFRIDVRCDGASLDLKGSPTLRLNVPSVAAALQAYDPTLIAEFT